MAKRYAGAGSNNGRLPYSVREAATELQIGKSTAARALRHLEERGFIVAITRGGFNCKIRHSTEWRLTEFPCDVTRELATKDFARWGKNQNTVPGTNRTISIGGPNGTYAGTWTPEKGLKGTCRGTEQAL